MSGDGRSEGAGCLRLGSIGLSPKDRLLLRSVVQIVRAQTRHRWEFSEQPPYDVTFCGLPDIASPADADTATGIAVLVLPPDDDGRAAAGGPSISTPIRPHNLTPLLDRLGDRLPGGAATRSIPVERRRAPRLSSIGGPAGRAYAFLERLQRRDRAPFVVMDGDEPLVAVHPSNKTWIAAESANDVAARLLARPLPLKTIDLEPGDDRFTRQRARRLEALLWYLGVLADAQTLFPTVAEKPHLKLIRWPDFGSIGQADPVSLKLSALLASRAYRFDELVESVGPGVPRARIVAFLNGCALCGLLTADRRERERVDAEPAKVPRQPAAAQSVGRVMRMLRTALGISGA